MNAALFTDLLTMLDMVVMERLANGAFQTVGNVPEWFRHLSPDAARAQGMLWPGKDCPFLEHFLVDAECFWQTTTAGRLLSGPWSEQDATGNTYDLEATALSTGSCHLLCVTLLDVTYQERQTILQKAREGRLEYQRLARAEAALRKAEAEREAALMQLAKSHDDLVSILNRLRLGTVMLDAEGCITFLSQSCQYFLDMDITKAVGQPWEQVGPFSQEEKHQLKAMLVRPAQERKKVPVHVETSQGRRFWMDVEGQDDPRDPRRKIIIFYDTTEVHDLRRLLDDKAQFHALIGKSDPMLLLYQQIRDVAKVDTTVLIEGDTGTGKELVARAVHASSHRKNKPFIPVNCAGLSESLLASQLFGHRRGAFTGAIADQQGLFEAAEDGTLFLDEIGDVPLSVQTNLLRVLQEREITRLGETRPRKINVRIVAATHRNLPDEVAKGTFRLDLLYRIRVARLHLPALRQRRQDIPLLSSHFLAQFRAAMDKPVQEISDKVMRLLLDYAWPGNVRELRSAIEYAVIRCQGSVLRAEDLPPELRDTVHTLLAGQDDLNDEKQRIVAALEQARGSRTAAARLLGISRATFYRRLTTLGIPRSP